MLNELRNFINRYEMIQPGDKIVCAVSGGPDSMALLWGMYLLRESMEYSLSAAHFNHGLRGAESDRDEQFVRDFCSRYEIPLIVGSGDIRSGKKGLEAAARDARYGFLQKLPGKIATAHTADDNAETVLMHLIRGTGLRGLGGISPVRENVIRPMLTITRRQILNFLEEYHISWIEDSTNQSDEFLRNRIRHHVIPLLRMENPRIGENLSNMALNLRADEDILESQAEISYPPSVEILRKMKPAVRVRALDGFLKASGVWEPETEHILMAENLVFSENPSARANFPGGVIISRNYEKLEPVEIRAPFKTVLLNCPGETELPSLGIRITCRPAENILQSKNTFTVRTCGTLIARCKTEGDEIRLPGGTKKLKKLFIDRKIPANHRLQIPVIADSEGILGVCGIGVNENRAAKVLPAVTIKIIYSEESESCGNAKQ